MWLAHRVDGELRIGRVVETEAYLGPHDLAAHSSKGRTRRTEVMFGPPGMAYVYLIYGIHHCLNAVTGPGLHASAVLIRAIEPVQNLNDDTRGPGLVCRALAIDRTCNGLDLAGRELFFARPDRSEPFTIRTRPRIGVGYARDWAHKPFRFLIEGNLFVSRR
jgi:DNA-3-methyladenine glycosylase